ncbi:hypothetical protein [Pseudorhodoferax sp.]|uniref:hypothetical protein n=1 Tax=Pseudorhodoferax sp. TaxID=1993553 RepID=UPI002DD61B89|nr:hypothetical protein [Pseudorhodoferax sp.]
MRSPLHWLVVLLLVLALPLKGLAAAGPLPCGPGHGMPALLAVQGQHVAAGEGDVSHHGHDMSGKAERSDAAQDHGGTNAAFKCTTCAPCGVVAFPPTDLGPLQRMDAARVWVGSSPTGHDGLPVGRLDRPPRRFLA